MPAASLTTRVINNEISMQTWAVYADGRQVGTVERTRSLGFWGPFRAWVGPRYLGSYCGQGSPAADRKLALAAIMAAL